MYTNWSARFFCPLFPMAYYSYKISLISLTNLSSILVKGELKRRGEEGERNVLGKKMEFPPTPTTIHFPFDIFTYLFTFTIDVDN